MKKVVHVFLTPLLKKRTDHPPLKSNTFIRHKFSSKGEKQLGFEFYMKEGVFPIYQTVPKIPGFLECVATFTLSPNRRCFRALCSAGEQILHKNTNFLV
jgi:hypothetical protein